MKNMKLAEGGRGRRIISNLFESLPDEIVTLILCMFASVASSPQDFVNVLLICKRMSKLGVEPLVLSKSNAEMLAVVPKHWCDAAHRFLKLCINAGNNEASYILGMIEFYCLQDRVSGVSLLAKAGSKSHTRALHSLALIKFNGSGGTKRDKDLSAGVALCERAAFIGHVDALRELGYCHLDGYGVQKDVEKGRKLILQADARELVSVTRGFKNTPFSSPSAPTSMFELLNTHGCNKQEQKLHPATRFLIEWFGVNGYWILDPNIKVCSNEGCGIPETRRTEFRKCSGCWRVNYCSRGCQARHWRMGHKVECGPVEDPNRAIDELEDAEDYDEDV